MNYYKLPQQNINKSETWIGGFQLSVELHEHERCITSTVKLACDKDFNFKNVSSSSEFDESFSESNQSTYQETSVVDYRATWATFKLKLQKLKKKYTLKKFLTFSHKKVFLMFQEMELSSPNIKKTLIFSKKKLFLYFGKWNFLALSSKNLLYFF